MINTYQKDSFIFWTGKLNTIPNPYRLHKLLETYGLKNNHMFDILEDDIVIYPIEILCANNNEKKEYIITNDTISVHHYKASWSNKNITYVNKIIERFTNILIKICQR